MKTIAIIMARGGSKGLPRKNVKLLAGKPLIAHTIEHAISSGVCDEIIVTTEDKEIAEISKKYGAKVPFIRPANLADDITPPEPVIKHALLEYEKLSKQKFDIVVYLTATDLFRDPKTISDCVEKLKKDSSLDTVFSAYKTHKHFWKENNEGKFERITEATYSARQKGKKFTYREDQGLACAFRAEILREQNVRVGKSASLIPNDDFRSSIDIHNEFDFWLAETVFTGWNIKDNLPNESIKKNSNFLGSDLKTWSQSIRNGYIRAFILFALHETGVFELLKNGHSLSTREIAEKCKLNSKLLDGVLNFLFHSDQILKKENEKYSLTEKGLQWLFTDPVLAMSYGAVGALSCILTELVPSLKNEKKYGIDFERKGELIAKGSYHTGKGNYPWVVNKMRTLNVKKVADLGCGSADVIINLCKLDKELKGVGVDISKDALIEAKSRVTANGMSNRINLIHGDLYKPETFVDAVKDVDGFNSIMVMHEFLRDGKDTVIEMFKSFKKNFKGKYFFLGEFDCLSDEEYQSMDYPDRIHFLFYQHMIHPLTNQGLLKKEEWLEIFKKANVELIDMNDKLNFRLVQFVLKY